MPGKLSDKQKEQKAQKDRQISVLAGQLKQAGFKPDFKQAKAKARSKTPDGGKSGGKGSKSRESFASRACFVCGSTDHLKVDGPQNTDTSGLRAASPSSQASSADSEARKKKMPCFNHRPWETPPKQCLKGDQCGYLHSDQPIPGHIYSQPKSKSRDKGSRKTRPRGGQIFMSVLAMGAALTGLAQVPTANSLDTFGFSFNEDALLDHKNRGDMNLIYGNIGRIGVSTSGGLSGALGAQRPSILKVNGIAGFTGVSVDWACAEILDIPAVGNMWLAGVGRWQGCALRPSCERAALLPVHCPLAGPLV